jgi:hypothetical protein
LVALPANEAALAEAHAAAVLGRRFSNSGSLAMLAAMRRASWGGLASREERQEQNHLSGFVFYDHHQSRIVVRALFSQLHDFALGIRKCRCNIGQVCTIRVILNPTRSAYYEEISRHPNALKAFRPEGPILFFCVCRDDKSILTLIVTAPAAWRCWRRSAGPRRG